MIELPELNELQLQRLVRNKTSLKASTVRALHDCLVRLCGSPRFELLRMLQVRSFHFKGRSHAGPVEKLTLGELVEHGAIKLSSLPSMGDQRIQAVVVTIEKLLEDNSPEEDSLGTDWAPPETAAELFEGLLPTMPQQERQVSSVNLQLTKKNPSNRPHFISIKTEQNYLDVLERLRNHPKLSSILQAKMADYWIDQEARAPFEECLTFQQLLSLKVDSLLRKRSINERKLSAIIGAIENCLSTLTDPSAVLQSAKIASLSNTDRPGAQERGAQRKWAAASTLESLLGRSLIAMAELLPTGVSSPRSLLEALGRLPLLVTADEFAVLLASAEYGEDLAARALKIRPEQYGHLLIGAREKVARAIRNEFASFATAWEGALSGVGCPLSDLLRPFIVSDELEWLQLLVGRILVESLGARPWEDQIDRLSEFYTKDSSRLLTAMAIIAQSLPKENATFHAESDIFAPQLPRDARERIFRRFAHLEAGTNVWDSLH